MEASSPTTRYPNPGQGEWRPEPRTGGAQAQPHLRTASQVSVDHLLLLASVSLPVKRAAGGRRLQFSGCLLQAGGGLSRALPIPVPQCQGYIHRSPYQTAPPAASVPHPQPASPSRSPSPSRSLTLLGQVAQVVELPGEGAIGGVVARHRLVGARVPPPAAPGSPAPGARAVVCGAGGASGGPGQQQQEQRHPGPPALPGRSCHRCAPIPQPGRSGP